MTNNLYLMILSWALLFTLMSIAIPKSPHPMIIIIFLLMFNMTICSIMSTWKSSFLPPMIFILIMISGLLIIFLYFSSLISNELSKNKMNLFLLMTFLTNIMFLYVSNLSIFYSPHTSQSEPMTMNYSSNHFQENLMVYIYSTTTTTFSLMMMMLLLLSLLSVIKICSPKSKSLRKMA